MKFVERAVLLILVAIVALDHVSDARAGGDPRIVSAGEFSLVSDLGKNMGSFRISTDGLPEFVLRDARGQTRIVIAVRGNGDAIVGISDTAGTVRAALGGDAQGRYSLQLSDESTPNPRLGFSVASTGLPRISMWSTKNKEIVSLGANEVDVVRLAITSGAGDSRLEYGPARRIGGCGLYLLGEGTTPRAGLEIDEANAAHVFAQDTGALSRAELLGPPDTTPSITLRDRNGKKLPIK